jgi:hypothetical protein
MEKIQDIHDRIIVQLAQYNSFDIMCVLQDLDEEDLNIGDAEILDNDGPR